MVAVFQFDAEDCGAALFVFLDAARIDGKSMQQRVRSFVLILGTKPGVVEKHGQKKQAQKICKALTRTLLLQISLFAGTCKKFVSRHYRGATDSTC